MDPAVAKAGFLSALILPELSIKRIKSNKNYYDQSYLEWQKAKLLATPVDKQRIRTALNLIMSDSPNSIEAKAIKRFNDHLADLELVERMDNLNKKLALIFGELPPPGA